MMQAAGGLSARGHRVTVVAPPSSGLRDVASQLGVEIVFHRFRHLLDVRTILGLRRIIRAQQPDVIHVHKGRAHWLARVALCGNPRPVLIANRGVSFPLTPLNRGKYRSDRTDRIITVCEAIKDVIRTSGGIDPHKIEVVYAGTDMERFNPSRLDRDRFRKQMEIPGDAFVILQSGTRRWKGWQEVVSAFEALREVVPNSRLLIVGNDGAEREAEVRAHLLQRGLSDLVHVLGYRPDIEWILAAADVTVDASWHGTGITGTIRESMAVGTPAIATDCGGNRELIRDPKLGWLVEPRNHAQLLAALEEAATFPGKSREITREAQSFVRANFSVERRIDRLESVYLSALSSRRAPHGAARAVEERASCSG